MSCKNKLTETKPKPKTTTRKNKTKHKKPKQNNPHQTSHKIRGDRNLVVFPINQNFHH